MGLSRDVPCRLARLTLTVSLVMCWTGIGQARAAQADPPPAAKPSPAAKGREPTAVDFKQSRERFSAVCDMLEAMRRDLPRETFDPQAVVARIGRDPAKLTEWVRSETQYLPYRGMLRGPVGVLQDRCGNSLDRALLLAELLQRAGMRVQLANATLDGKALQDAQQAAAATPRGPATQPAADLEAQAQKAAQAYAARFGLDANEMAQGVAQTMLKTQRLAETLTERTSEQMALLLQRFPQPPAGADTRPAAAHGGAVADHWWVQFDDGGRWVDADPLLAAAQTPPPRRTLEWKRGGDERIPLEDADCHRVIIRVVAEQLAGDKRTTHTVLEHSVRPAELIGQRVYLFHHPMKWPDDLVALDGENISQRMTEALKAQSEWVPMLNVGRTLVRQAGVMSDGQIDPNPPMSPIGQVAKAAGGAAGAAADLLNPGGPLAPGEAGVWSAEWIEIETQQPGGDKRVDRRTVFDLLGPGRRAAGETTLPAGIDANLHRGAAFAGKTELLLQPCRFAPEFVQDLAIAALLETREGISKSLAGAEGGNLKQAMTGLGLMAFPKELYQFGLLRFLVGRSRDDIALDRVNVTAFHQRLVAEPGTGALQVRQVLDVIANDVAVRPSAAAQGWRLRLEQGVIDTNAEVLAAGDGEASSMAGVFEQASAQSVEWVTLRTPDDAAWSRVKVSPDVIARVREDLNSGATVVIPAHAVQQQGRERIAWWRVDPASGQSLGMTEHGGAVMAERAFLMVVFILQAGFNFYGCGGAATGVSTMKQVGCGVCAVALAALSTLALGGAAQMGGLGALGGAAGGATGGAASSGGGMICNAISGATQ